ncbi:MAG: VWA domain-containing protein [Candidatus Latescibacteria bacterium]|nr:VWA domain-containing protein [Candidatus Latescibacterota bacterium]
MGSLSFLSPLFLYGALGALVPLALHLIKRERARKRVFSTIRFLKLSSHAVVREQKIRRLILLLLRMAACAVLAMIFARPFLNDADGATFVGATPKAMALVIDTSYSMGFGSRIDLAKRAARELITELNSGDQVILMTFSSQGHLVKELSSDFTDLDALIESRLNPTSQTTNYIEALRMADEQLSRSGFEDRSIHLLSDFQSTGWDRNASNWKLSPGIKLRIVDFWDDRDANIAVTGVDLPRPLTNSERTLDVVVRVKNFGFAPYQGEMSLTVNGQVAGSKRVSIPSQAGQVVTFRHNFKQDTNAGVVDFGTDPLEIDNKYYFTVNTPAPLKILIVEDRSSGSSQTTAGFYLNQALNIRPDPPMTVDTRTAAALSNISLGNYQAVILADVAAVSRPARTRLTEYVNSGGGLIIGMNPNVSVNVFNSAMGSLLPGKLVDLIPATQNRRRPEFKSLSEVSYLHPVFQPFSGPHHGDFGTARFFRIARIAPDSAATIIGRFDDGSPAIIEKSSGSGRILMLSSTFSLAWNDLPIRGVFLPFLYQTVDYLGDRLGRSGANRNFFLVGESVRLESTRSMTITSPSNVRSMVSGSADQTPLFTETNETGLYQVGPKDSGEMFAVNLDTDESDISHVDIEEFVSAVINPVTESQEARELKAQASMVENTEVERRQKLWWYLSLMLLVVVLAETLIASRTHR